MLILVTNKSPKITKTFLNSLSVVHQISIKNKNKKTKRKRKTHKKKKKTGKNTFQTLEKSIPELSDEEETEEDDEITDSKRNPY